MKRPYVVLLLILCSTALFAQNYTIEIIGTVEGPVTGKMKLSFEGEYPEKEYLISEIVDGRFHFRVDRKTPVLAKFHIDDHCVIRDIYIEGPRTSIKFTNEIKGADSLNWLTVAEVTGSSIEKLKQSFETWLQELRRSGLPDSVIALKHFQQLANLIQSNPSSKVGPYLLSKAANLSLQQADSLQKMISPSLANSWEVKETQRHIQQLIKRQQGVPGKELKDFKLLDSSARFINLSDFRGKYLLIVFGSLGCKSCRKEFPGLNTYYNTHKSSAFEMLSVYDSPDMERWIYDIKAERLTWPQALDEKSAILEHYGFDFTHLKLLVDKTGRILGWNCELDEVETLINGSRKP